MRKNRIFYLILMIVSFFFFLYFDGYLSLFLIPVILLLPIFSFVVSLVASRFLTFQITVSAPSSVQKFPLKVTVSVNNRSFLPVLGIRAALFYDNSCSSGIQQSELSFPLSSFGRSELTQEFSSLHCGKITISLSKIRVYDYLGLFAIPKKSPVPVHACIFPPETSFSIFSSLPSTLRDGRAASSFGDPDFSELSFLRDYRDGDRLRDIHWKASTKLGKTLVKEYDREGNCLVTFLTSGIFSDPAITDLSCTLLRCGCTFLLQEGFLPQVSWKDEEHLRLFRVESTEAIPQMFSELFSACPPKTFLPSFPQDFSGSFFIVLVTELCETLLEQCIARSGEIWVVFLHTGEIPEASQQMFPIFHHAGIPLFPYGPLQEGGKPS